MRNYDKSLLEVWEWKDKIYQEVKNLSAKEYVVKLKTDVDKILADKSIHLKPAKVNKKLQKV